MFLTDEGTHDVRTEWISSGVFKIAKERLEYSFNTIVIVDTIVFQEINVLFKFRDDKVSTSLVTVKNTKMMEGNCCCHKTEELYFRGEELRERVLRQRFDSMRERCNANGGG